jgi:hypothetical protein
MQFKSSGLHPELFLFEPNSQNLQLFYKSMTCRLEVRTAKLQVPIPLT